MRRIIVACSTAIALFLGSGASSAEDEQAQCVAEVAAKNPMPHGEWDFDSIFGTYDQAALKRGFQVYKEVCSACHSMKLLAFRNLEGPGGLGLSEP